MQQADVTQIGHLARLAVLGMCARGVAGAAFADSPEVQTVVITVTRPEPTVLLDEFSTTIEYGGAGDFVLYGATI